MATIFGALWFNFTVLQPANEAAIKSWKWEKSRLEWLPTALARFSHIFEPRNVLKYTRPQADDRLVAALDHKLTMAMESNIAYLGQENSG